MPVFDLPGVDGKTEKGYSEKGKNEDLSVITMESSNALLIFSQSLGESATLY